MTQIVDLEFDEGENWRIVFTAHNVDGTVLALESGSEVDFRLNDETGMKIQKSVGDGVFITDAQGGVAEIAVQVGAQTAAGIVPNGMYVYAIRVMVAEDVSIQAKGRVKINRSIFTGNFDPLLFQFRARFPEFSEDDDAVTRAIADASLVIGADDGWPAAIVPIAKVYLAAHLLQFRKGSSYSYSSAGGGYGQVKSISVEDRSVSFATDGVRTATSKTNLGTTGYGIEYLAMFRRRTVYLNRA